MNDEAGNPSKLKAFIGNGIITTPCEDKNYNGVQDFNMAQVGTYVIAYKDNSRNAIAVDASLYPDQFGATQKIFDGPTGVYNITLTTLKEVDGESTYRLRVANTLIGTFQNPVTSNDMEAYTHIFQNIAIKKGDVFQIESNTHSNGTVPEGDSFAWARGRWRSIEFNCQEVTENDNSETCNPEEVDGLLVFEAERFQLNGDWKLGVDTEHASGGEYIYFDGPNSYAQPNSSNNISYTFKINNAGTYVFKWLMRQPEEEQGAPGKEGTDLGNDAWFYFSDDIAKGGTETLTQFHKFVGRSDNTFVLNGNAEVNHKQSWVNVTFAAAGEYTLNLSGRSHGLQIDRIVLFKDRSFPDLPNELATLSETKDCNATLAEPTSIELPSPVEIRIGTAEQLMPTVEPSNASTEVSWVSSDTSIATVDIQGLVTAITEGTATITATSLLNNAITGTSIVNVVPYFEIPVTSISINPSNALIYVGNFLQLEGNINPSNADNKNVTWSSSDTTKATVDANGKVTAIADGIAIITATTEEGGFIANSEITVQTSRVASISFDDSAKYKTTAYYADGELVVNVNFHAGSGNTVLSNGNQGIKYWLRHLNSGWVPQNDYVATDTSVVGQESGTSTAIISLTGAIPTANLANGDFYWLWVNFKTSDGDRRIETQITGINILNSTLDTNEFSKTNHSISIYPNPVKDILYIDGSLENKKVAIFNLIGSKIIETTVGVDQKINVETLNPGVYFLNIDKKVSKFIKK